jgi:hypothetical protein
MNVGKRPDPMDFWLISEAIFQPELSWIFSDDFRLEYCFHFPGISDVFLLDTVTFQHLSCRILRDPVAEIVDLG